jgi:trigger factor
VKLTVERLPESQVRLEIAADEAEFAEAVEKAAKKVAREVAIPGFRKGKVPRHMIERMYGREIFLEEAHKSIMDSLYRDALKQEELVPVGDPEVEMTAADPVAFKVVVSVYPTIDAGDYSAVRVEPIDAAVKDEQVNDVVERMQKGGATWVEPAETRKPQNGDQVTVSLAISTEDGEPFQDPIEDAEFIIGESQLFEPLKNAIVELEVGESTDVTIAFDEEDQAATERLRGQAVTYSVTLKTVKERRLAELNDEFAKTVAGEESYESLLKAIREDLHQAATNEARNEVLNAIVEKIAEGGTLEVPAPMVDDAVNEEIERLRTRLGYQRTTLEAYLRGNQQTEEELRAEVRPTVAKRLRNSLFLRNVAEREEIKIEPEEIEAEVQELIGASPNPENARKIYEADRYLRTVLSNDLFDRKLSDRLIEIATESRGAVINAWVKPEPAEPAEGSAPVEAIIETEGKVVDEAPVTTSQIEAGGSHDCPSSHPIKGNASSKIYHLPGSGSYDRTMPEICFATADDATAAGYRASKSSAAHAGQIDGDGTRDCPGGFSIKGNASSNIYHLQGGRSYDQTIPEVCFASEEDAVAAGYRASKAGAAQVHEEDDDE